MNPYEEYLLRHKIQKSPMKFIEEQSFLILKNLKPKIEPMWLILTFEQKQVRMHPNEFTFTCHYPLHNFLYKNGPGCPLRVFNGARYEKIHFEQYEERMMEFLTDYMMSSYRPVYGLVESKIAAMEIFYYCCDQNIAKITPAASIVDATKIFTLDNIQEKIDEFSNLEKNIFTGSWNEQGLTDVWNALKIYTNPTYYADWLEPFTNQIANNLQAANR